MQMNCSSPLMEDCSNMMEKLALECLRSLMCPNKCAKEWDYQIHVLQYAFSHISTYVPDMLHWLPVEDGIICKIILMEQTSTVGRDPECIGELCVSDSS